jgi:hypothetical protein
MGVFLSRQNVGRGWVAIAMAYVIALQGLFFAAPPATAHGLSAVICAHDALDRPSSNTSPSDKGGDHDTNSQCCAAMACCSGLLALGAVGGFSIQRIALPRGLSRDVTTPVLVPARTSWAFSARGPPTLV